jgi:hypothetical protein
MTFGVAAVSMRAYFSADYLWGAKHFAALARSIEDAHDGPPRFSVRHRAYVTNSILSSVAFLEALINEFFDDAEDGHLVYLKNLTDEQREKVAVLWKLPSIERASILDKFQIALVAVGAAQFDKGAAPFQDAVALVKLRNQLVHARVETRDSQDQGLSGAWQTRFPPNKLMHNSANPYIFDHLLGAGCADWAVRSAIGVADSFLGRTGANANYKMVDYQDDQCR